ncbi:hypothetical protein N5912_07580 [Arcobacter lacus]|uniref:hypothetical protein n=1 Tax=Arcobacter lacus TaxID=1912876 RepID=UPI0021BB5386|nr:hypothetical protein [Arcobacter lacus]MCT7911686.1 hypothetical protein [Arcobacter lacus]
MFEIIGIIVSAICFLVGLSMIVLFIAVKFEYFSEAIINRASKTITTQSEDIVFEAFIKKLRDKRKKDKR